VAGFATSGGPAGHAGAAKIKLFLEMMDILDNVSIFDNSSDALHHDPAMNSNQLDFEKLNGLLPAIVQDADTGAVLMLGFMNKEAWDKTLELGKVTFFSRTRNVLWTKGETSGNFLEVREIFSDCDSDTILIKAIPHGPTCHTGSSTCFTNRITA
jgi:phosphoribosyl-AMP cyclohydrolase